MGISNGVYKPIEFVLPDASLFAAVAAVRGAVQIGLAVASDGLEDTLSCFLTDSRSGSIIDHQRHGGMRYAGFLGHFFKGYVQDKSLLV